MHPEEERLLLYLAHERATSPERDRSSSCAEIPVETYISQAQYACELRSLFRAKPVCIGFASQVAEVGHFITQEVAGVPVLVVRTSAGLRAYLNTCRHRGARLVEARAGSGLNALVCPYHAWCYDHDGRLVGMPSASAFNGLDRMDRGLVRLPVATRAGLLFVVPGVADLDIDTFLGPFARELSEHGLDDFVLTRPKIKSYDINWKLLMDSSLETYHFRHAHARTVGKMFCDDTGVFDWVSPHARMILPKKKLAMIRKQDLANEHLRDHANLIYAFFPSTIVLLMPDHANVLIGHPLAVNKTRIISGMLIPSDLEATSRAEHWEKNDEIFWAAIEEDFALTSAIQSGLENGANQTLVFGRNEHLAVKFHAAVSAALKESR